MKKYSVVFLGSAEFAVDSLKVLHESEQFDIQLVVTQPDKKFGRKQEFLGTPVKKYAEAANLTLAQPERASDIYEAIERVDCDFLVVVAYGKILPKDVIELPTFEALNVHGSILPKYRGAAPIHYALMNGDDQTGVCVMRVVEKLDAGPVYGCKTVDIYAEDDFDSLAKRMAKEGAELLVDVMKLITEDSINPVDQEDSMATYCSKISKDFGDIDFVSMSAKEINNRFRAFKNWPKLRFEYKETYFQLVDFDVIDTDLSPGEFSIKEDGLHVGTKKRGLLVRVIKPQSKSEMAVDDFVRGNPDLFPTE